MRARHPSAAGPGGRRSDRSRIRGLQQFFCQSDAVGLAHGAGRPGRGRLPGHRHDRRRQDAPRVQAGRHRLALADSYRDALRDRRRQPGQGSRQRLGLPEAGADHQAVGLLPRTPRRSPLTSPTWSSSPTTSTGSPPSSRPCPSRCSTCRPRRPWPTCTPSSPSWAGHRPPGPGQGRRTAKLKSEIGKIVASEPAHAKPLTYYYELATEPVLLRDVLDLHRQPAVPARHEEHRRRGDRAPPQPAATRRCRPSSSSRPTRTTSSWRTPAPPAAGRRGDGQRQAGLVGADAR